MNTTFVDEADAPLSAWANGLVLVDHLDVTVWLGGSEGHAAYEEND